MSLSQQIAPHLPYLRRYARALTGCQASGDAYVIELLEAILEAPDAFSSEFGVRAGLYRAFTSLFTPVIRAGLADGGLSPADTVPDPLGKVMRNLAALSAHSRQAFLLKAVEGFSLNEIAYILNVDTIAVSRFIARAGQEISECVATDVLIIEDEPLIAAELSVIVRELGHSIVGVARTHDEALALIDGRRVGLVLADIQLADGSSGINAVNRILEAQEMSVVFITAFPEKLLTGLRPEPTFLIAKPYRPEAVKATIVQSLFFNVRASATYPRNVACQHVLQPRIY